MTRGPVLLCAAVLLQVLPGPGRALGFCGFFVSGADGQLVNNASQAVLYRKDNHTVMTLSNNYKGPPQDFAMVVPVPVVLKKEQVKTLEPEIFQRLEQLSAPRLVEYFERDPCDHFRGVYDFDDDTVEGDMVSPDGEFVDSRSYGVRIEARFAVGEYQILILSASDSTGLDRWLRDSHYKIPPLAAEALAPYIRDQMKFFVAKVDIKKVHRDRHGLVVLSPLRFSYDADELRLPVRLGLLNAEQKQDLIVYVLNPVKRFEVANYPNVFIPTNLEVDNSVRGNFPAFYAELFDETLRRSKRGAVVTEYVWDTGSCDPCPTPPLDDGPLLMLMGWEQAGDIPAWAALRGPLVLTRLHTRYDRKTLSEDLVFRGAGPVEGGRAIGDNPVGVPRAKVVPGGQNNFQGRYIIRHYWEGKVTCKDPHYGNWSGQPRERSRLAGPVGAAEDLANVPRGRASLKAAVVSPVPSLGLPGKQRKPRPGEKR